jgi:hypothetical protein
MDKGNHEKPLLPALYHISAQAHRPSTSYSGGLAASSSAQWKTRASGENDRHIRDGS